jgi:hypothetical protein
MSFGLLLFCSPAQAGVQPRTKIARGSAFVGAARRLWTPAFAGEQGDAA